MAASTPSKGKAPVYPPLIIHPTLPHKQTFIVLHGRGSNALKFAPPLLAIEFPDGQTLQTALPHAKFIFPTATARKATIFKKKVINQWFDYWSLDNPTEREELQIQGLRETSAYIHDLLEKEIALVGAKNVVLGGLSQGCAASLISLLTWQGEPLAAAFGMCGWIPFRKRMSDIVSPETLGNNGDNDDPDPFARDPKDEAEELTPAAQAVAYLRKELEMDLTSSTSMVFQQIPLFLGHGVEDEQVPFSQGKDARDLLKCIWVDVTWKEYEGLAHWYSSAMLGHLVDWLREKTDWHSWEEPEEESTGQ
ncbi:hypothetical protein OEA41_003317 [Lepraria neglecta]|uniref:Phospholipase/carboxylesterase/thioesterase domain-containing protein n=1 Tax=Lepraria neglecta TaxID=209136 RepID=A0AAD9Z872_9LECA|nr:hypothetical protein OEA41_003317 [Lepraria neglecta]